MAKKTAEKEIRRLKKKVKEATAATLALEKRVRKLTKKLNSRKQQIVDLQAMLGQGPPTTEVNNSSAAEFGDHEGTSIASSHHSAWKQHSYLRDRYEFHLGAGSTKNRARQQANEDLKQAYGQGCGYTEDELSAILS